MDPLGACGDGGEDGLGRGDREVVAVVLADAEEVEAEPIGEHGFVDDVADHLRVAQPVAVGTDGDVAEGVESELQGSFRGVVDDG